MGFRSLLLLFGFVAISIGSVWASPACPLPTEKSFVCFGASSSRIAEFKLIESHSGSSTYLFQFGIGEKSVRRSVVADGNSWPHPDFEAVRGNYRAWCKQGRLLQTAGNLIQGERSVGNFRTEYDFSNGLQIRFYSDYGSQQERLMGMETCVPLD